ncbi:MAG: hypothetical protein WBR33_02685, partial [Pseudonocardiaceae bacterium]
HHNTLAHDRRPCQSHAPRRSHHAEAIKNYQTRDLINLGYVALALARPQASMFGQDAYPSVWGKAGALVHSLVSNHAVSNHALVDGNKRLG